MDMLDHFAVELLRYEKPGNSGLSSAKAARGVAEDMLTKAPRGAEEQDKGHPDARRILLLVHWTVQCETGLCKVSLWA